LAKTADEHDAVLEAWDAGISWAEIARALDRRQTVVFEKYRSAE
jgi:hypothetical protein